MGKAVAGRFGVRTWAVVAGIVVMVGCGPQVEVAQVDGETATDADADTDTYTYEGQTPIEVTVVEHEKTCIASCDGFEMGNVLTVELRSEVATTVEVEWLGTLWEGYPYQELWRNPVATAQLPAGEPATVVLSDRVMQCGMPTVLYSEEVRPARFEVRLDDERYEIEGASVIYEGAPDDCS